MESELVTIEDITKNWTIIENYLKKESNLSAAEISDLHFQAFSMDTISIVLLKLNKSMGIQCNSTFFKRYLTLNTNPLPIGISLEVIADKLCNRPDILPIILENIRIDDILELAKVSNSLNPKNLASASNITYSDFQKVEASWKDFAKIYANVSDSMEKLIKEINLSEVKAQLNVSEITMSSYPQIAVNFLCGEPLKPEKEVKYKLLQPIITNGSTAPKPVDNGCSIIYETISSTWAGKVAWRYLAPIIRGNVYITPNSTITNGIKAKSQWFFDAIDKFRKNVNGIANNYMYLQYIESYKSQMQILSEILLSKFFEDFKLSKLGEIYNMKGINPINLTVPLETVIKNKEVMEFSSKVSLSLKCINTDRIKLLDSELDILEAAKKSRDMFLAGVIFLNPEDKKKSKRDVTSSGSIPKHVQYKIRMETDSVPITSANKERLWVPGPDGDFYYNMKYFWGFIQIQDMIDNAIIELQTGMKPLDTVLTQQFPYPCFPRNNYLSGIYTAQLLQVALIFGCAVLISTFVREHVWDRESKNGQLMQVMGMNSYIMWISNFLVMFIIFAFNALLLSVLLYFGGVLPKTKFEIILITFLVYFFSLIMFIYMMTTILKKSTSGSIATFLLYILTFLPFLVLISLAEDVIDAVKILTGFFMTTSFGFSILYITRYEQKQLGLSWENIWISPMEDDNFSYFHYLIFMMIDAIICGIIGLIISKLSNLDGSWYYCGNTTGYKELKPEMDENDTIEGIRLVSLTKEYRIGRNNKRVAVDSLNLHLKKNEITGLLGHNGAGKSTTMSMLTGILQPTGGSIIVDGVSFNDQWESYRKMVGYCPQYGILYDNLNTREHITLYAHLKSKNPDSVENNVKNLLSKMSLEDKDTTLCKHLSEGLRRRLAIAIAFAGDSSIVILDEPTSGVDSNARRHIWDFITECKSGKTIIITTHHMDEAEILCDNIAIIHKGKLLHAGTTLQLQEQFGRGLQLNISLGLHSSNTTEVTSVNSSRMSMTSPVHSDRIDLQVSRIVPRAEKVAHSAQRRSYSLPVQEEEDYQNYHTLFAVLENEKKTLDITTFSISSPNLEDIFLAMTLDAENGMEENIKVKSRSFWKGNQIDSELENQSFAEVESHFEPEILMHDIRNPSVVGTFSAILFKRFKRFTGDKKMIVTSLIIPSILMILAMILGLIRPGTLSPPLLLTPSLYGPESLSFMSKVKNSSIYNALINPPGIGTTCMAEFKSISPYTFCSFNESKIEERKNRQECKCVASNWNCDANGTGYLYKIQEVNSTDVLFYLPENITPNKWILDNHYDLVEKQFGGWKLEDKKSIAYYNNKGFHSSPAYLNALNNARLRSHLKGGQRPTDYGITVYSHPFRSTQGQILGQSILQHVSDYTLALLLLTVISFVPTSSIIYLIQERTSEEKLVLRTFSVGPFMYWITSFIWDVIVSLIFVVISAAIIKIFGVKSFSAGLNFPATLLLFFLYSQTVNTFVYLLEKVFTEPSIGQVLIFTGCVFTGVLTLILMLLFYMYWWIKPLADARKYLSTILLILPPYALGE